MQVALVNCLPRQQAIFLREKLLWIVAYAFYGCHYEVHELPSAMPGTQHGPVEENNIARAESRSRRSLIQFGAIIEQITTVKVAMNGRLCARQRLSLWKPSVD